MSTNLNVVVAKIANRVLRDYPLAGERLAVHAGKRIDIALLGGTSPLVALSVRITPRGAIDAVGEGASDEPAVAFSIPVSALPALMRKDETAYAKIAFTGDSELAHTLSTIARNVEWDIEEDLSKLFGGGSGGSQQVDAIVHTVGDFARTTRAHVLDAGNRLTENIAEYLRFESNAFVSRDQLEAFAVDNEALRDAVARLEARLNLSKKVTAQTAAAN
jgi:ubiquinone biosynthesis protein UbiJ